MINIRGLKYFDWLFFGSAFLLCLTGLTMIYSIGLSGPQTAGLWVRQLIALAIGLGVLFFFSNIDYHFFQKNSNVIYLIAVLLLFLVLFFGLNIRGSTRWFDLGYFNFQPSEFSKLAVIIILAKFFQRYGNLTKKFRFVLWSGALVLIPTVLIMLEPDLGSAAIHIAIWGGMLIMSPMPKRYLLYLLVIFAIVSVVAWNFVLQDYQQARILSFLEPTADPLGQGYNVIQSIVAIGSGGVSGRGLARGLQSQLQFLPERQTDFIFASTVEELGMIGGILVLFLFFLLFWRMLRIMTQSRDLFGMYLATGAFLLLLIHLSVNVGMNLGLLPVTGVTLPFMSYGGSSLITMMMIVGIVESVAKHSTPVRFG